MFRLLTFLTLLCGLFVAAPDPAAAGRYASIVVEADTGRILYSRNANSQKYPASLTKIMTLFMTFEALKKGKLELDQKLPVSRVASSRSPSKLGLKPGETITVRDAISALVTKSANDVATVLAEAIGGTERKFAVMMTSRARYLGMKNTTFKNASGLPNRRQLSTATDMAILARALLTWFPQEYKYFAMRSFKWNGRTYRNHNRLLGKYKGVDGIKTGYIRASGFNLVASAKQDGVRIIAVMFGGKSSASRNKHVESLLDKGFAATTKMASASKRSQKALPRPRPRTIAETVKRTPVVTAGLSSPRATTRRPAAVQSWAIQVGAYNRYDPAKGAVTRAAKAVPSLVGTQFAIVHQKSSTRRGRDIYKARLLVDSKSQARQSCAALKRRKIDCMVIWMGPSRS